jgi:glycosyltransferase involved in cell wall biosynthesis
MYRSRYPEHAGRIRVIENGFDEESFAGVTGGAALIPGKTTLLHSGLIYPVERDPTQFFETLAALWKAGRISPDTLMIRFRAPAHDKLILGIADRLGVLPFVECLPPIPYRDALGEMMRADGLLVMQAANCNEQIPAKVYEYLRSQRPLIGLTDPAGDTADLMTRAGVRHIAPLDAPDQIAATLMAFLEGLRDGSLSAPPSDLVTQHSRLSRTSELVDILARIVEDGTRSG